MTEKKAIAQEEKRKKDEAVMEKAVAKAKRSATMAESGQVVRLQISKEKKLFNC